MDINQVIARAKAILLSPKTEWPVIAERTEGISDIYRNYLIVIAAVPAVMQFLRMSVLGIRIPFGGTWREGIVDGLVHMALQYGLALAFVYVLAVIIDSLAPNFGGQRNKIQAFKTVAYASTAGAVASVGFLLPIIGGLIPIAGAIYTLYLIYMALPITMKVPQDKSLPYLGLIIAAGVAIGIVASLVLGSIFSHPSLSRSAASGAVTFDKNSVLGQAQDWSKNVEAANKKYEAAQKSGNAEAQKQAMGEMMGSIFSGGDVVEALAPEKMKGFLPASLLGLTRSDASAERSEGLGMQTSNARARYTNGADKNFDLEITDLGSAKGITAFAGWAGAKDDRVTDTGYEKTFKDGERTVHEKWDSQSKDGEYSVIVGERFSVKVAGQAGSIDELKSAAEAVDLSGLEALKGEGVKKPQGG